MKESIAGFLGSGKRLVAAGHAKDLFIVLILALSSAAAFGLGRLSALEEARPEVRIERPEEGAGAVFERTEASSLEERQPEALQAAAATVATGNFVASKSGVAYYFPFCGGVKRIKEENKVYFDTKEEAEAAGYRPAANCQGL